MSFFSDVERELVVTDRVEIAEGIVALDLASSNGRPLPAWTAGSHIDLVLGPGRERQYSLCSDPDDRDAWRIAVLREAGGRGGSAAVHALEPGRLVRSRGPRSHFDFEPPAAGERAVFVAGGIGITPVLPMVRAAAASDADWSLDYAVRSRAALPFGDELAAFGDRVRIHVSDEGARIDIESLVEAAGDAPIWACGPARMLDALTAASTERTRLHVEPFTAGRLPEPVRSEPFEIELLSTGDVLEVPPDRSILEVLEENGVLTVSSCREGTCGTCETVVVDGVVDHRDRVLSVSERATSPVMMVCVSRAACPRLVLDA
ncbi:PDR/VanB family oxidoreductase [Microbacterium betulae]|uniref:PDR/VanB family oxidoreductase n=1 Tax=Microbacterium betulae TaxID=2981139 RepID=A0AA97FKS4_9MICO|nr:PDR/VanB family oxidoreductase [Microbacterium sp. AB]WOF23904.1 PDR/VanB family oxidoreductase [Microbacterium sp. AB]